MDPSCRPCCRRPGPAVVVLPTPSLTTLLPVCAFAVSVPSATLVERLKLASLAGPTPEPPSVAVQPRLTSLAGHASGAASHRKPAPSCRSCCRRPDPRSPVTDPVGDVAAARRGVRVLLAGGDCRRETDALVQGRNARAAIARRAADADLFPRAIGHRPSRSSPRGAFLSILLPPTGPARDGVPGGVEPSARLPVCASSVSAPAATLVDRLKLASPAGSTPEPPSVAVHAMLTSLACQSPSAEPQLHPGRLLVDLVAADRARRPGVTDRVADHLAVRLRVVGLRPRPPHWSTG